MLFVTTVERCIVFMSALRMLWAVDANTDLPLQPVESELIWVAKQDYSFK